MRRRRLLAGRGVGGSGDSLVKEGVGGGKQLQATAHGARRSLAAAARRGIHLGVDARRRNPWVVPEVMAAHLTLDVAHPEAQLAVGQSLDAVR